MGKVSALLALADAMTAKVRALMEKVCLPMTLEDALMAMVGTMMEKVGGKTGKVSPQMASERVTTALECALVTKKRSMAGPEGATCPLVSD